MKDPKGILITGANSGIGEALALYYAKNKPGVHLVLTGRNTERLANIKSECESVGANVEAVAIDVTDAAGMKDLIEKSIREKNVDLIIANAGVSETTAAESDSASSIRTVFDINVTGVLNTILPAVGPMAANKRGQLVVISSMTAYWSYNAYAASKIAVKRLVEGMRLPLAADNVEINVVCPGFVRSRMTNARKEPVPLMMEADEAAKCIADGLESNIEVICFPVMAYLIMAFLSILPDFISKYLWSLSASKKTSRIESQSDDSTTGKED